MSPLQTLRYPTACQHCGRPLATGTNAHRSQTHYRCQTCGPHPASTGPATSIPTIDVERPPTPIRSKSDARALAITKHAASTPKAPRGRHRTRRGHPT